MMNTLIRVLGHTLVWVSSNNLYVVYHRLAVLMLYILLFITIVACRLRAAFVFNNFIYYISLHFFL